MNRLRRLPSGAYTADAEVYREAWRAEGEFVEDLFPGYEVYGYDPGISLKRVNNGNDTVTLSMPAVAALRRGLALREGGE